MIQTLAKIGEQLLEGKGVWARLTTEPKYDPDKKYWVCPILFDVANKQIRVLHDQIERFVPNESSIKFRYVKATRKGPSQNKFDLTVEANDLSNLEESLFGKKLNDPGCLITLRSTLPEMKNSTFETRLLRIKTDLINDKDKLQVSNVKEILGDLFKDIVLFTSYYLDDEETEPIPLFENDEFSLMVQRVFSRDNPKDGISFITGDKISNAVPAQFWSRYNIHKVFQTSTLNFASSFNKQNFYQNFQGNDDDFDRLDRASRFVLNNFQTRIAGITHIVIPHFLNKDLETFQLNEMELYLDKSSELLFGYESLDADIERGLADVGLFWINYIAFESDGNSFKVMNHIKDVNSVYLAQLTETFVKTGLEFQDYIGGKFPFNLRSVSNIIPVRDSGKSKINPALSLFKDVLEQRPIQSEVLFKHFIELILCHWYGRYAAFKNIRKIDSIDFAIKDAVYKYSALIYTLKQLKLIDMEKEIPTSGEEQKSTTDFQQRVQTFFERMNYSEEEKALFYLGRILSAVAYAQYKKGHESKPILNKVNYNGMDTDSILRLSLDLREKSRQYTIHDKTEWNFSEFTDRFNEKTWSLSKEQGVFYLMAGYSFGLTKSDNNL